MRSRYRALYGLLQPAERAIWEELNQPDPPPCFTREQWRRYQQVALMEPPLDASYCQDCTAPHQMQMLRCGRCRHPEVWFNEEGEGSRSERKTRKTSP